MLKNSRSYFLTSDMEISDNNNNMFKKTLKIPQFTDDYTHVTLISASIPNSFSTIQKECNESFILSGIIDFRELGIYHSNIVKVPFKLVVNIPEGSYNQNSLVTAINNAVYNIKYTDLSDKFDKEIYKDVKVFSSNAFFKINTDKNRIEFDVDNVKMNYYYQLHSNEVQYECREYINTLKISSDNLSYKYLGLNKNSECLLFKDCYTCVATDDITEGFYEFPIAVQSFATFNKYLPNRPSILWVNSLQIRLNIVNVEDDSNILMNIPITDFEKPYITYQNYDLANTAKRLSNSFSNGFIEVSITQQNGYEIDISNIEYCFNILLFKVENNRNLNWGYQGVNNNKINKKRKIDEIEESEEEDEEYED